MNGPKAFDDLTERGQAQRLRQLALHAATRHYGFEVTSVRYLARSWNTFFRIDTADGQRYAMRVENPVRIQPDGVEAIEASWCRALHADAGIDVPQVVLCDGEALRWVDHAGVPGGRAVVVFTWASGRPVKAAPTPELVVGGGALLGKIHRHSATFDPGAPTDQLRLDRVLYWQGPDLLHTLRERHGTLFDDARDRAQQTLDALWADGPHPPHLLHGDFTTSNVLMSGQTLVPVDFQDLMWGFRAQDVAISVTHLHRIGGPEYTAAFRRGYESVEPWPITDPDVLQGLALARLVSVANFGLHPRRDDHDDFVERFAALVRAALYRWRDTERNP